jgi:quinol monooxygenase YgiN
MMIVTLRIKASVETRRHIVDLFESYGGPVSVRAGCMSVNLYSCFSEPGDFILLEEWSSRKALEAHVRSEDFRKVLAIMDLAGEPPELRFCSVSSSEGFEMVERLRSEEAAGTGPQ